ncbi:TrlF family AAA-like ATPase [Actinoplanes sp. NPDC020271]|uniref:TrlF family AAA-like ATPase n=1 Tax=Actinoplanes sp. NPDC020271 TaxID=3363896 RepID=UPI0037B5A2A4
MTAGGARWRRVDFHLHTPAVSSFAGSSGMNPEDSDDQQRFAEAYAQRLNDAGIEIAAITDYNGIRQPWFDLIRQAAARRGIDVLPGVELSVNVGRGGIHILAVFPGDADPQEINECLRSLDREAGRQLWTGRIHSEIELRDPLPAALRHLRDRFGCLLFGAHAGDRKGLVDAMGPKPAAGLISEVQFDGLDHAEGVLGKLKSTGVQFPWDHLALVEFSDPRSLADVGGKKLGDGRARGTWLKLSATDLDAMRLALHDPETRVRTDEPAPPRNGRLISMRVEGRGFLNGLELTFDPHLNTLIGGRGTGKSAILETIRYGLGLDPYCDADNRQSLVKHALGAGGMVRLQVERSSDSGIAMRYEVVRVLGEDARVIDPGTGSAVGISPQDAFGPNRAPVVLLQREIDVISKDPEYRRRLLDRLIGDDVHRAEAALSEVRRKLSLNSTELRRHRIEQARLPELEQRIAALEHELRVYEDNGVLEKLKTHRRLDLIDGKLAASIEAIESEEEWSASLTAARTRFASLHDGLIATEDDLTRQAADALAEVSTAVERAYGEIILAMRAAHHRISDLRKAHANQVQELTDVLNGIKQELHAEKIDADATLRWTSEVDTLSAERDGLIRKQTEMRTLQHARRGILDDLGKARENQSRVRQDAAEMINGLLSQRVEVVVTAAGDRDQFATDLRNLLAGSGVQAAAVASIAAHDGVDGVLVASTVDAGPEAVCERFGITRPQADRIHAWLTSTEVDRLTELEALAPRDQVNVRLKTGQESRDLDRLSTGQRATAILLLIFAVDGGAMLLDQPEDDLDNEFIFEDVVSLIREQKALTPNGHDRQIIAATHNPNIPMLGDAELVAVLGADSTGMLVTKQGSIDDLDIRTHVRQVLEGGEEAFMRRYHKYGGMRLDLPTAR